MATTRTPAFRTCRSRPLDRPAQRRGAGRPGQRRQSHRRRPVGLDCIAAQRSVIAAQRPAVVDVADHSLITGWLVRACLASNERITFGASQFMDTVGTLAKFQEEGSAQIHPVILSGGAGTRLWPLSRASYPKQLLKLCVGAHDAAGHRGARTERRRLCRTAAGLQRGSSLPGRRPAAADRHQAAGHPARAAGAQHRAGDRRRRPVAAGARSRRADAGAAVRPCHRLAGRLPSRRHARPRRGAGRPPGHLRHQAEPRRHRLRLHPERRAARRRRRRVRGRSLRREAGPRDRPALRRQRRLLLEQRHLPAERARLSRRAVAHQSGHAERLRARRARRPGGSRLLPPVRRVVRRGARAVDRPCRHGAHQPRRRRAGRHGVERCRLMAGAARHRPGRRRRQRPAGRRPRRATCTTPTSAARAGWSPPSASTMSSWSRPTTPCWSPTPTPPPRSRASSRSCAARTGRNRSSTSPATGRGGTTARSTPATASRSSASP